MLAQNAAPAASQTAAAAAIPRLANGHPDFSGVWQTLSEADYDLEPHEGRRDAPPSAGVVIDGATGGKLPYLPEAREQQQANFEARAEDDPRLKCWTLGVPRSVYYPAPFQIFQRDNDLTLVHQFGHQVRTIYTNGTLHPGVLQENYWLGDSRASWDGDTLVVDVTHFNAETWLDRSGNYHGEKLHVVERWNFIDANTIAYQATVEDPEVFSQPWTLEVLLHRRRDRDFQLIEDYCHTLPYADYYPHNVEKSVAARPAQEEGQ
ncbi:hypothetical protein GRI97_09985 [Altererythrobacter xixiisoli]|uniref:Uncharacterized protein n=1 Tax=Croceibacterium xixiisoli TaxID=1476466 RepID=A0A6I4TXF3_9SPHN|nr:hypothetical protein [Croceibacterium xixiisoli]